jgi:hypothetical protein
LRGLRGPCPGALATFGVNSALVDVAAGIVQFAWRVGVDDETLGRAPSMLGAVVLALTAVLAPKLRRAEGRPRDGACRGPGRAG